MKWSSVLVGLVAAGVFLGGCSPKADLASGTASEPAAAAAASGGETVSFTRSIKPIFANKCTICHNVATLPTRPSFETREQALQSGMIVPGKPEASRILTVVQEHPAADMAMPPVSHRLTKEEISLLETWIREGANWPAGRAGRVIPAFIPEE